MKNQLTTYLATLKGNIKDAGAQGSGAFLNRMITGASEGYKTFAESSNKLAEAEANINVQNQNAANSRNAGIQRLEDTTRQQETDARRSSIAKGLAGISDYVQVTKKDKNAEKLTKEQWAFLLKYGKYLQPNSTIYDEVGKDSRFNQG